MIKITFTFPTILKAQFSSADHTAGWRVSGTFCLTTPKPCEPWGSSSCLSLLPVPETSLAFHSLRVWLFQTLTQVGSQQCNPGVAGCVTQAHPGLLCGRMCFWRTSDLWMHPFCFPVHWCVLGIYNDNTDPGDLYSHSDVSYFFFFPILLPSLRPLFSLFTKALLPFFLLLSFLLFLPFSPHLVLIFKFIHGWICGLPVSLGCYK